MKLVSWNVNGIRAAEKKGFGEFISDYSPDILCVQETKAHEDQLKSSLRHPEGYCSYFCSAQRKGYSGTALYSKTEPVGVEFGFGVPEFDTEGRIIIAEYEDFILYNIYFPNGKMSPERLKFKLDFYDECLARAKEDLDRGRNAIICGDVNTAHKEIDLARPKENSKVSGFLPEEREWIDRLISAGFIDSFRIFTIEGGYYSWWDMKTGARQRNVGWRIDYFFVSDGLLDRILSASILSHIEGSDHAPIELVLK